MLLTLTDDCLDGIYNYLSIQDHLTAMEVCKDLENFTKNRLNSLKRQLRFSIRQKRQSSYSKQVEQLKANSGGESYGFDIAFLWFLLNFDQNQTIRLVDGNSLTLTDNSIDKRQNDYIIDYIRELFPQLEKLTIRGHFEGNFIAKFKNLTDLEIDSPIFKKENLDDIRKLKLKKISLRQPFMSEKYKNVNWPSYWAAIKHFEEMEICRSDYTQLALQFVFMLATNLKTLILTEASKNACVLLRDRDYYAKIDSIRFNVRLDQRQQNDTRSLCIGDMEKLRVLCFVKDDGFTLREFCKDKLKNWNTLEEIYYNNAEIETDAHNSFQHDLLTLVANSRNLKILDVSGTPIGDDFVKQVGDIIKAQSRKKALLVRCHNTNIAQTTERIFLPKGLSLLFEGQDQRYLPPQPNSIEICFEEKHSCDLQN